MPEGLSTTVAYYIIRYMDMKTLLKVFGSQSEIARKFGVSRQAVSKWMAEGLPLLRQYQAKEFLRGKRR